MCSKVQIDLTTCFAFPWIFVAERRQITTMCHMRAKILIISFIHIAQNHLQFCSSFLFDPFNQFAKFHWTTDLQMVPKCERLVEILNFLSCIKEIIGIGNKNRCLPAPQRQIYVSYATPRIVLVKDNIRTLD